MAVAIDVDSHEAFNYLVYGDTSIQMQPLIAQQANMQSPVLHAAAASFIEQQQAMFDATLGSVVYSNFQYSLRNAGSIWNSDDIRLLTSLDDIQLAPQMMIPYIMALPELRTMHQQQMVYGYGERYIDVQPEAIADNHDDYRKVMDGMLVENTETDDWQFVNYMELQNDETSLSMLQKFDVVRTWDEVKRLLALKAEDPTSPWGDRLS